MDDAIPLRALIVDDSDDDAQLLLRELARGGYQTAYERVDTAVDLRAMLERQSWDIIFSDYTMPRFSGAEALAIVRERDGDAPFIFVSGTMGEDTAVAAMKAGAQDYVVKDNLRRLCPTVQRELRETRLRRAHARSEAERRASDARFQNILHIVADAVIVTDENLRIEVFNQGAERMFGYSAADVVGLGLDKLLPVRYFAQQRERVQRLLADGAATCCTDGGGEIYCRRGDGTEFPVDVSISKFSDGCRTSFTMILRDMTQRKQMEEELRVLQTITQAVAEAADMQSALTVTLAKVCETTGWTYAQAWIPRADDAVIECSDAWYCRESGFEKLRAASLRCTFAPGKGLPGRVWDTRQPVWLRDLREEGDLSRASVSEKVGLRSGLGVPVLSGQEVIAVLEFFARDAKHEDGRLLRLAFAVAAQLGSVIQRKRAEEHLDFLAHHDSLTGLPNRLLFVDRLTQSMVDAQRHECRVAVMFLDLDRFKVINDSLGHTLGDAFLRRVAERIEGCVRQGDTLARLSGDEFALILADIRQVQNVGRVAHKILDAFTQPFHVDKHELYTSASIGITLFPDDEESVEGLVRNADIAMYRAKESGGNAYQFFSADMTDKAHERLAQESALWLALEHDDFQLHYQPIVNLKDGKIISMEALVRWRGVSGEIVSPAEFMPLAEETGLVVRLGEWVLRRACEQWCEFQSRGAPRLRLAVNISPRQFQHGDLCELIDTTLGRLGFDPKLLDLEITENLLMRQSGPVLATMRGLSERGITFSVDDFGTGYSSLSYLQRLPISRLKIDRSFVRGLPTNTNDAIIVAAIISVAHKLGIRVVAEGVETHAQLEFLRAQGCDAVQGYLICRPLAAEDLMSILRDDSWRPPEREAGAA